MRITVGNLKGGVAKSTSAVYISLGLARTGRVLLVDADGTNASVLDWSSNTENWPTNIVVIPWAVEDLARRVKEVAADYDHIVIDTGPEQGVILRQAMLVTDELVVPVSPSPMELRKLGQTWQAAAEIDAISPVTARVLLAKVRSGTKSATKARLYVEDELELPLMGTDISLLESYAMAWGTAPTNLDEYEQVLAELLEEDEDEAVPA